MAIRQSYLLNGLTTRFSFPHPVRDISELKVLYNPQTSPTPISGTEVVQSGNWTAEGVGTRSSGITVIYPAVPLSGTLIIVHSPIQSRVAGPYSLANPPTPATLNEEFDHIQAQLNGITGGNAAESIDTLDTRLDALESQNIDNRLTDVEVRALLEDVGDAKFDAENKKIKNLAQPTDSDSGHAATVDYVLGKVSGAGNVPAPLLSEVGRYLRAIGVGIYGWVQALASHIGFTPSGDLTSTNVQDALAELDTEKFSKAGGNVNGDILLGSNQVHVSANPTSANHLARKGYVDAGDAAANANANSRVSKDGDVMSGPLQNNTNVNVILMEGSGDQVFRWRNASNRAYVGFIRSVADNYIAIKNEGVLGPTGSNGATLRISDDRVIDITIDGDSSPILLSHRFGFSSSPVSLSNGANSIFTLSSLRFGFYVLDGIMSFSLASNAFSTPFISIGYVAPLPSGVSSITPNVNVTTASNIFHARSSIENNSGGDNQRFNNWDIAIPFKFLFRINSTSTVNINFGCHILGGFGIPTFRSYTYHLMRFIDG